MYKTNPFRYIRAILRPSNKILRVFIETAETKKTSPTMWSTMLNLAFPVTLPFYGKFSQMVIHHEYPFEKRVQFQSGRAVYLGYVIKHPNVAHIVLYEYPRGSFDLDKAKPVPSFRLKEAPGDYSLSPMPLVDARKVGNPVKTMALTKTIGRLRMALSERTREAMDWHNKCIRLEEAVDHKENELRGLISSKSDFWGAVVQTMLTIRETHLTIENALKSVRKVRFTVGKWVALILVSAGILTFIYLCKDMFSGFGVWISSPSNQFFTVIVAIILGGIFYYLVKRR